jgi:predicted nuclease with TOPRIM domain
LRICGFFKPQAAIRNPQSNIPQFAIENPMTASGLEKFSHLEDKIFRAVELCKTLKQEKEILEKELDAGRERIAKLTADKNDLEEQLVQMLEDREAMKLKVEAMLDAIAMLEMEAESLKK